MGSVVPVLVVDRGLEETDAHLVGRLLAPTHILRRRVGVRRVRRGIIEMGNHLDVRTLRECDGLDELVGPLPVKVPVVDPDEVDGRAVGPDGLHAEILAEPVHVGDDRRDVRVPR